MSRFDFLKDKFQPLYEKCTQAEQATDNSDKTGIIRRTLEYLVCELGEDGNDLFNNIGNLSDKDILDENVSRLFHRTRIIANRGVHYNTAGSLTDSDVQIAMDNLAEITIWYAVQYEKQSCHLNDFAPEDVSVAKRYLDIHADAHSEAMSQMIQATVNVDPLAVMGNFDEDDDIPVDPLEKDVFETDEEYAERIAQMEPIHIGYGILDMRKGDGYTNVRFLQHHLDKNKRVRFTQSPVYFFVDQATENSVIDGELVAKLRVYDGAVYCDYSCVFLRSDEVDIPVQVICWDKMGYENEVDYQKRIEALPILPLALCKPIRSQYDIKQQILPFKIQKYAYVHISMGEMYDIPCNRDLAKQITAQKQMFTMFGKILNTGEVTDFILWNRESKVLYGTANALGMKQKEEQQENNVEIENALERIKYKQEKEQKRKDEINEYLRKARNDRQSAEGLKWYRLAAEQGDAEAQNMVGRHYSNGWCIACNYEEAAEWFRKAAEQGDKAGQYNLGRCYHNGKGIIQNCEEAVKWYRKAAEQGAMPAQYTLGNCYYLGEGVSVNYEEAVKWYRKAAEQGLDVAQNDLGNCYYNGNGVSRDYTEAVKWYRKAAEQGNVYAQKNLGNCYYSGDGVSQDYTEAVKWYRKAAEQGSVSAQSMLGDCYYLGNGVDEIYEQAAKWYRIAAEQGDAWAQNGLGNCYSNGEGVIQNYEEAIKWYRKAAEQGLDWGQWNLGFCYHHGEGVSQNYEEAIKWYRKAAEQGLEEAKEELKLLSR